MLKRRIVITGMGLVNPSGNGASALWSKSLESKTALSKREETDPITFPVPLAGFIRDFNPRSVIENRKSLKVMCRDIQMAVVSSYAARESAGLMNGVPEPSLSGVAIGAGIFEHEPDEMADSFKAARQNHELFSDHDFG